MYNYFEAQVNCRKEGDDKPQKNVYLVEALTFCEAEGNITKYLEKQKEFIHFVITGLKTVHYQDLIYDCTKEDLIYFESKVEMKNEEGKMVKYNMLVLEEKIDFAVTTLNDYLSCDEGNAKIKQTKELPVKNIVLKKKCCNEICEDCDTNIIIIGLDEQMEIEFNNLS